ncbi:MAG: UvrD-helicase domain-containing protein [Desulfobacteraceae bacterium]|nr:UvrD-helicase domain-containing protein [Desulfobacteraceae bacterium]
MIPRFTRLLATDPAFRREVAGAVGWLFVDEFQDLNRGQYELVLALAATARVFAIGDPDQAIYGFRGSDLRFFFDFAGRPETESLALSRNYRSAPAILQAAGTVIRCNRLHSGAVLRPQREEKIAIERFTAATEAGEAEFVVRRIEELMGGISHFSINSGRGGGEERGRSFGDFAVLYRTGFQAAPLAEALGRRGIPCQQVGATPFYMGPGLRAAAWLVRTAASGGVAAHLALLREVRGIGTATLASLERAVPLDCPDFFSRTEGLPLTAEVRTRLRAVAGVLRRFGERAAAEGLTAALREAMVALEVDPEQEEARRLFELAGAFGADLAFFARHLEENAKATIYDPRAEAVALMTLHAAKGLEFPVVFLAGLEEGLLPLVLEGRESDIEEERRLFYVGLTRAREALLLTEAAERTVFGRPRRQEPSRFLQEIPAGLLRQAEDAPRPARKKAATQMRLF